MRRKLAHTHCRGTHTHTHLVSVLSPPSTLLHPPPPLCLVKDTLKDFSERFFFPLLFFFFPPMGNVRVHQLLLSFARLQVRRRLNPTKPLYSPSLWRCCLFFFFYYSNRLSTCGSKRWSRLSFMGKSNVTRRQKGYEEKSDKKKTAPTQGFR